MIIDTHTHFYDPTRPQGAPWPSPDDEFLYRRTLPEDYRAIAVPEGVTGTVVVEASVWVEDNQWVLDLAAEDPIIVGLVGHLEPSLENFGSDLIRFAENPLFLGIRLGAVVRDDAGYLAAYEQLMAENLELDLLIGPDDLPDAVWCAAQFPDLRIVLNHVGHVPITGGAPDSAWFDSIKAASAHANVFCKVSGMVELAKDTPSPAELAYYTPTLDALWHAFGEDRLVYGSNWPVSARCADYATVQRLAVEYFEPRGTDVLEKVMWKNSKQAYRWIER